MGYRGQFSYGKGLTSGMKGAYNVLMCQFPSGQYVLSRGWLHEMMKKRGDGYLGQFKDLPDKPQERRD